MFMKELEYIAPSFLSVEPTPSSQPLPEESASQPVSEVVSMHLI